MVERLVPDGLWELVRRVVPEASIRPQGGGRRRYGDREVLAAIIVVATTGCAWARLPPVFGLSGPTAHRRSTEWRRTRVWAKLHRLVLDELGFRGELDWSRCAVDSVDMRALKGGPDRFASCRSGQEGRKDPLDHRSNRTSDLLSTAISGANLHDSQALQPLVRAIPPIRFQRGTRRRKPGKLRGDKGHDYDHLHRWLRERGAVHRLARKGVESPKRLGGTVGRSSAPWPGWPDAAGCIVATSAELSTSSRSPAPPAR